MPCGCASKSKDVNTQSILFQVTAKVSGVFVNLEGLSYTATGSASGSSDRLDIAKSSANSSLLTVIKDLKKPNYSLDKESVKITYTETIITK
jgi:hypothetical protein